MAERLGGYSPRSPYEVCSNIVGQEGPDARPLGVAERLGPMFKDGLYRVAAIITESVAERLGGYTPRSPYEICSNIVGHVAGGRA